MASLRQIKKGKEKVPNDDHRSHTHPVRRHSHGLSEAVDNDKSKVPTEKLNASGPIATAEFERLKKEVESLKKTIHEQRKAIKKQSKVSIYVPEEEHSIHSRFTRGMKS